MSNSKNEDNYFYLNDEFKIKEIFSIINNKIQIPFNYDFLSFVNNIKDTTFYIKYNYTYFIILTAEIVYLKTKYDDKYIPLIEIYIAQDNIYKSLDECFDNYIFNHYNIHMPNKRIDDFSLIHRDYAEITNNESIYAIDILSADIYFPELNCFHLYNIVPPYTLGQDINKLKLFTLYHFDEYNKIIIEIIYSFYHKYRNSNNINLKLYSINKIDYLLAGILKTKTKQDMEYLKFSKTLDDI